jgi:hypothetical protein
MANASLNTVFASFHHHPHGRMAGFTVCSLHRTWRPHWHHFSAESNEDEQDAYFEQNASTDVH